MALSPNLISYSIISAGTELKGPTFPLLCTAIGSAVYQWALITGSIILNGVTTGSAGSGIVNGTLKISPNPLIMVNALQGQSISGLTMPLLAGAVSNGIASAFSSSGQYQGNSVGVSVGADLSKVLSTNSVLLCSILTSSMISAFGGAGPVTGTLASGLSLGIAGLLQTAVGVGVVSGPPSNSPATGSSISNKVF